MSYQKTTVIGNLGANPEKKTGNDKAFAVFPLAANDRDEVTWFDVLVFGKQAETVLQYKKKGDQVHVEGRIGIDTWKSDDGEARGKLKIFADRVTFLSSGEKAAGGSDAGGGATRTPADDDIPFA